VLLGTFDEIISYFMFAVVLFITLTVAGLFVMRRRQPDAPYLTPLYPFTPAVYILLSAALLVLLAMGSPRQALLGVLVVALGLPVYYLLFRGRAPVAEEDAGEGTQT
jgi:APA family basic amino acid/polyamine antiporter